jgi:hypothetical protein
MFTQWWIAQKVIVRGKNAKMHAYRMLARLPFYDMEKTLRIAPCMSQSYKKARFGKQ